MGYILTVEYSIKVIKHCSLSCYFVYYVDVTVIVVLITLTHITKLLGLLRHTNILNFCNLRLIQ